MRHAATSIYRVALVAVPAALAIPACLDTQDEFDKFLDRSEPFRSEPVAGECSGPVDLSGRYLLGIEVSADRSKPLRYEANFDVDVPGASVTASIQALATADGAPIGDVYEATSALDAKGGFALDFGTVVVPPAADPILPTADVSATFKLVGCTSTPTFACGLVEGDITVPVTLPLAGSTWALVAGPDGTDLSTLTLVSSCPK